MTDLQLAIEILGLSGDVTEQSAKLAYRSLMKQWHPDLHQSEPSGYEEALSRAKSINAAYEQVCVELDRVGTIRGTRGSNQNHTDSETQEARKSAKWQYRYTGPRTYRRRSYTAGFPDPEVFEVFVRSSNLLSAGYSRSTRVLYIKFQDGSVYRYFDVPPALFEELLAANSHGSFAHRRIYGRHRYERCH